MASSTSSPFTQSVVSAMRRLYPEYLADKSFDNTGLLWEAPAHSGRQPQKNSVLLTNDLTTAVADEAIERKDSVIVAYHPIIFFGLKSLTLANSQQSSLLRLASEGISVYCPHTAIDAAEGGNGDWIADIITGDVIDDTPSITTVGRAVLPGYQVHCFPSSHDAQPAKVKLASHKHTRVPIQPNATTQTLGIGRLVTFSNPRTISSILHTLTTYLSPPAAFPLALPQRFGTTSTYDTTDSIESIPIRTVAICCGSGGSVLGKGEAAQADLWVTGELVHHEALAAIERGTCVVAVGHSNSERAYLGAVLKPRLEKELEADGKEVGEVEVAVSTRDRDPYGWVVRSN